MRLVDVHIKESNFVPRPSITANAVEGLVKLLRRMTSGGVALPVNCAISHDSRRPPDVILRRSFTKPSTVLAVIEGLGTRLKGRTVAFLLYMYSSSHLHVFLAPPIPPHFQYRIVRNSALQWSNRKLP